MWVGAPAGSGKTSLVSGWIEARGLACAWYQVDAGDADPATFFHYLRLAGKAAAGRRRVELPHLTPEYLPGIKVFVRRFFERFFSCFKPPFVFVLDNYQEVPPDSSFHAMVDGALHALPAGGQLVCVSREASPGALARWGADTGFQSVGWDALRLTDEDARLFARRAAATDEGDVISKNRLARGWAAGFKLLLQAGAGGFDLAVPGETAPQTLFDYFANEVFDRSQVALRDFLLKTSLLPNMSVDVARRVSAHDDAEQMLARLHRNRLFTERRAQPGATASYEYHPLFREFLLQRARRELTHEAFAALQRHTALLLEETGQMEAAAAQWLGTKDWPSLERLICRHAPVLVSQGRIATLEDWMQAVPDVVRDSAPWLLYWLGVCRSLRDPSQGRQSLARAYAQFKVAGDTTGAFLALAGIITGYFQQRGELDTLDHWIAELEGLLAANGGSLPPAVEVQVLGSLYGLMLRRPDHPMLLGLAQRAAVLARSLPQPSQRVEVAAFLIQFLNWRGEFGRAAALAEEFYAAADATASVWNRILIGLWVGSTRFHQGQPEAAIEALNAVLELARESGIHALDSFAHVQLAYVSLSMGNVDAANRALDAGWPLLHPNRVLVMQHYRFLRAGCLLVLGRVKEALAMAREAARPQIGMGAPFGEATFRIPFGEILMLDGQHSEAREHLGRALDFARRMPSAIIEFQALMALAYSYFDTGEDETGLDALRRALAIGASQNYTNCQPLWISKVMSRLCARAMEADIEPDYVRRLIAKRGLAPPADRLDMEDWPWRLRIYTLGRFAVVIDGEALKFPAKAQKKPLELLRALVALGGHGVSLGTLAGQLWPETEGDAGRNALNVALHRLRRLLGNEDALALHGGKLSLDLRHVWVDAWAFERLASKADAYTQRKQIAAEAQALGASLLRLYLGHFLAEEEAPWAIVFRERLRGKFLRAGSVLAALLRGEGRIEQAADLHRRVLELDPLAEEFHRGLIRCLKEQGRIAEALDAYRHCRDILSVTLGVQPSAETQALYRGLKQA